jgi:hypothetical protein
MARASADPNLDDLFYQAMEPKFEPPRTVEERKERLRELIEKAVRRCCLKVQEIEGRGGPKNEEERSSASLGSPKRG